MKITRKLAITILKYLDKNKDFYFPFLVMNQEYMVEDDDFVEIEPDEWEMIESDENYQTFELWENLQNLGKDTEELLAKGFIEKITDDSLESRIAELAKKYRKYWKKELCESEDMEAYGLNEFISGKADVFEDCLCIIKKSRNY
ncbi:hypothetical protein KKB43_06385 [Patescibacteria group bacterium]|nr:hypothetical protein [Patescibacteria group bacterium]MBU4580608.1 hypothetical protein [Patescibacteria group bacterium]